MASMGGAPTSHPLVPGQPPHHAGEVMAPGSQKSFRRKYLKIRHFYKAVMNESNHLIREEERMKALARRLQEQVDELQDVLLDLNDEARLPSFLRYDLGPPSPLANVVQSTEDPDGDETAQLDEKDKRRLEHARKQYAKGEYTGEEYNAVHAPLASRLPHAGPKPLTSLLGVPHTHYPAENLPDDLVGELDDLPGFMSPTHEQAHIEALDKAMNDPTQYNPNDKSGKPLQLAQKVQLSDKDLSLVNPVSPLNWLRKYQPQVFLQDPPRGEENASEKSSAKTGGRGKRGRQSEPIPKEAKADHDGDEDGTFVPEFGGRGKKNKDDEPYRPKGGSGRGSKRKRGDDGETPVRKRGGKGTRASLPG